MDDKIRKHLIAIALCLAAVFPGQAVDAAQIPFRQKAVAITVAERTIVEVLKDFFEDNSMQVVIDAGVEGTVKNAKFSLKPQEFLDVLGSRYGFTSFYDGQTVYISPASQNQSRIFKVDRAGQAKAKRILMSLRLDDNRNPVRYDEESKLIVVTGPMRYVSAVEAALSSLEDSSVGGARGETRVFYLKSGIAQDRTLVVAGKEVVLPGVASLLKRVFGSFSMKGMNAMARTPNSSRDRGMNSVVRSMTGVGSTEGSGNGTEVDLVTLRNLEMVPTNELPVIEALPALNAVAIRDLPDRIRTYEGLIEKLDVKPRGVELEVSIIDVSTDGLQSFGFDWRVGGPRSGVTFSGVGSGQAPNQIPTGIGGAVNSGRILSGATGFASSVGLSSLVQVQLNALVSNGSAKVVSNPRIVTLLSEEGTFSNNQTFYVKVAGNLEANLFAVEAGTTIRLTPVTITDENGRTLVRLVVRIEDGKVSQQTVDSLPVTQKSSIVTNAVVPLGESLALAGLIQEETSTNERKVPGIGDVSFFGSLFKSTEQVSRSRQRLFLITPRLVE
jgi:type III secretion protein C